MAKKKAGNTKANAPFPIDQFLTIRRCFGGRISPDGSKVCFVSTLDGRYNLWSVPAEGGWPTQLTFQDEMIMGAQWVLGGKALVFSADFQGNENRQLFMVPAAGGAVVKLTDRPSVQTHPSEVAPNGRLLAYSDNRRKADRFDTYTLDLKTFKEKRVLKRDFTGIDAPTEFSPDGTRLLVYRDYHNLNSDVILVNLRSGKSKNLTAHEGDARFESPIFSGDGKHAFVIANIDREFRNVMRIDLKTGEKEWFHTPNSDIAGLTLTPDGKHLIVLENRRANLTPRFLPLGKAKPPKISWPAGLNAGLDFSQDGKKLLYSHQGPKRPADIWVVDTKTDKHTQVTHSLVGGFKESDFVAPKYVSYTSFDGLKIHGLLYVPKGVKADGTAPAILYPHGGPNAQNQNRFTPWLQTLASRGYVVFAPDFRGSTGYGKTFQKYVFKDWGGGDFQDLLAAVDYLKDKGWADPKRIGVLGMSYGGFAVLTCITRAPKVFKAAVDVFGPANLFTFIDSNPPSWREGVYALVGHPVKDREYLEARSPMNHVDHIRSPLLVIQGKNDPRVAQSESDQVVEALKKRKRIVEYKVFEDEGHGFSRKENEFEALKRTIDFLGRYM